jgi:hypothetical protein
MAQRCNPHVSSERMKFLPALLFVTTLTTLSKAEPTFIPWSYT